MTTDPKLRTVFDSLRVGIVSVDSEGRVELQNAEASRILGVSARTTVGRTLDQCLGEAHPAAALLRRGLGGAADLAENRCTLPPRLGVGAIVVDLAVSPIETADAVTGSVLTLRDRTIGDELAAVIDQRSRAEEFARVASSIAHEVRNPLGGIRGAAQLLEKQLSDPSLTRYSELIRRETDRISGLLDDLAVLTHGRDLQQRESNLHEILDDLLDLAREDQAFRGLEIKREYDPSMPGVWVDTDRIRQVFLNLARNSAQAMDGDGTLTVRTRVDAVSLRTRADGGRTRMMRIDVLDTGPGIAAEDLPHVFSPFYSTRPSGTGLGLAIAQQWVVRHGGTLELALRDSGSGTRASVLLPFGKPA